MAYTASVAPRVAAKLAKACLDSVPLGKDSAIKIVDSLKPYLDWQSDEAYKADPPSDYGYPPVQIHEALAKVRENLVNDKYKGEADFQLNLYETVFAPGHDGHYVYYPDAMAKLFSYARQRDIISVSEDGSSIPVIKILEDVRADGKSAKVVSKINGEDAAKYVEKTAVKASWNQDVDSAYNGFFYQRSNEATSGHGFFAAGGRGRFLYEGANTTFTYADGSILSLENQAIITGNMKGVVDGPSFYKKFCTPSGQAKKSVVTSIKEPSGQLPGYPKPVIISRDGVVSGYYLDGKGVEDVAVIVLLSFESDVPAEFQAAVHDFIQQAKADGKKKLVIDVQGNGGGYILLGYDFYRQLFPHIQEDGYSRWRENSGYNAIAKAFSDESAHVDPFTSGDANAINDYVTWFNYRYDLNLTLENFLTFEDKFAPHEFKNTEYTAIMRWNLSDPLTTTNDTFGLGMEIAGYGNLKNLTQPFAAEDIVLMYDGVCASTCTLASEMLRIQGGVKSVGFGGRPNNGPIQGVGGVKGAQVLQFANIYNYAQRAKTLTKDPKKLEALNQYDTHAIERSIAGGVNVRDQILRDNVNDGLPAQFVVEDVDCRLYWTEAMASDITEVWSAAAQSAFNNKKCANGGIKHSGGSKARADVEAKFEKRASMLAQVDYSKAPPIDSEEWKAVHVLQAIP